MTKRLLLTYITMFFVSLVPLTSLATSVYDAGVMEIMQDQDVTISYSEGTLSVTGAEGETLEVVSLTGKRVFAAKIESPAQKIELNIPKGCYIVKVGKVVRKVSVR